MPRIPAVPGALKRAYSQSRLPKPRESYGNDLLGFAADRWSRINKAGEDLQALDDYAVQRRAYGGYKPEALNDMARSILAARADAARDFDRTFGPMNEEYRNAMLKRLRRIDELHDFQKAYNRQFIADPPYRAFWEHDKKRLRPFVRPKYLEQFDNGDDIEELADVYDYDVPYEMDRMSYPGTERYLETGIPEEGDLPRMFVDEANDDLWKWRRANWRDPYNYPSKDFKDYETLNWNDGSYYR